MTSSDWNLCHGISYSSGPGTIFAEAFSSGLGFRTEVRPYDESNAVKRFDAGEGALRAVRAAGDDIAILTDTALISMPGGNWRLNVQASAIDAKMGQYIGNLDKSIDLRLEGDCREEMNNWYGTSTGKAKVNPPACLGTAIRNQREELSGLGRDLKASIDRIEKEKSEARIGPVMQCARPGGGTKFHLRWFPAGGGNPLETDKLLGMDSGNTRFLTYSPRFEKTKDKKCKVTLASTTRGPHRNQNVDAGNFAALVDTQNPGKIQFRGNRGQFACTLSSVQMENVFRRCAETNSAPATPGSLDDRSRIQSAR
ncbi:MAG: hypothetical protein AB7F86_03795 [Bdellovibrionales bacterium]